MADWFAITDVMTDPGAPGTSELWKAWWKNPIAIAEGAVGAPINRAAWHPYDALLMGDAGVGLVYDHAVTGNVGNIDTPNFMDGYEYRIILDGITPQFSTRDLQVQWYRETSASYGLAGTLATGLTVAASGWVEAHMPRRLSSQFFASMRLGIDGGAGTLGAAGGGTLSPSQKILRARLNFTSDNIAGGKVYLYRRQIITNA